MGAAPSEVRRGLGQEEREFWSPRAREGLHLFLILGPVIPRKDLEGDSEQGVLRCMESTSHPLHLGTQPRFPSLSKQTNTASVPLKQDHV